MVTAHMVEVEGLLSTSKLPLAPGGQQSRRRSLRDRPEDRRLPSSVAANGAGGGASPPSSFRAIRRFQWAGASPTAEHVERYSESGPSGCVPGFRGECHPPYLLINRCAGSRRFTAMATCCTTGRRRRPTGSSRIGGRRGRSALRRRCRTDPRRHYAAVRRSETSQGHLPADTRYAVPTREHQCGGHPNHKPPAHRRGPRSPPTPAPQNVAGHHYRRPGSPDGLPSP